MRRLCAATVALAIVVVACETSGTTGGSSTSVGASSPPATRSTSAAATSTTTAPASTSTPSTTTAPDAAGLPDDAPVTFVAVTEDYEAVEVESASGTVLHRLGQLTDGPGLSAAPEEEQAFMPLIVDAWKTRDGSFYVIGECCEPAAGILHWLRPGEVLTPENHADMPYQFGWRATPTSGSDIMVTGETGITIGPVDGEPWLAVDLDGRMYPNGWAAWDDAAGIVRFIATSFEGESVQRFLIGADDSGIVSSIPLDWLGENEYVTGLSRHHTGQLLAVRQDTDPDGFPLPSSATLIVLEPDGTIVSEYGFASGNLGAYDASGRYMIFVDESGNVRWRGEGRTGTLAEGYIAASW